MSFVGMFVIGGITGVMVAAVPLISTFDTYFVVAHIHYVLFGGSVGHLCRDFHWYPKLLGGC